MKNRIKLAYTILEKVLFAYSMLVASSQAQHSRAPPPGGANDTIIIDRVTV